MSAGTPRRCVPSTSSTEVPLSSTGNGRGTADPGARSDLLAALGVTLPADVLEQALVHRSYAYENGGVPTNERLEFLGDAVLGLVVADELYRRHPDVDEDQLSRMRISVVNRSALAAVGRALGVGDAVLLGRGEEGQGGRDKDSILEDTTEALIGAVYRVHGMTAARDLVLRIAGPLLDEADGAVDQDRKTVLQVLAADRGLPPPRYDTDGEGPVHDRVFTSRVRLGGDLGARVVGTGTGRTKKAAEQAAATSAVAALQGARPADPSAPGAPTPDPPPGSLVAGPSAGRLPGGRDARTA